MVYEDLKTIRYEDALEYQHNVFAKTIELKSNNLPHHNTLLFCEHPSTITIGKNGKYENILYNENFLKEKGVEVFQTDRGGDITFHGPEQLVGYPIFDLDSFGIGLKKYIWTIEEIIIRLLQSYNLKGERLEGAAGVWLDTDNPQLTRKVCAIGVRCSHFVSMHGFALNVNTDLSYFSLINPCGFVDKGVTSMEKELGRKIDMDEVKQKARSLFEEYFVEKA